MKLKINSKKDFISNVLNPISYLNDKTILKIEKNKISSITAANDATLILHSETQADCEFDKNLNIPDIKKFTRVIETIDTDSLILDITNNSIKFANDNFKFTYHLLEEGIIKSPTINVNKINSLKFDTTFKVSENRLGSLFKGSSFTTETNKLYVYTENNKIYGELGDRNRHNSDNFQCVIADSYEGSALAKIIPINFETFRLINFNKCENIEFAINTSFGVIKTTLQKEKTKLTYIISALIN